MPTASDPTPHGLVEQLREGNRLALARAISLVENERPGFEALLHELHGEIGRASRIGITGPPGAGKSTVTARMAVELRKRGHTVGIVAVDPSSPFTGGALLGDRIRMAGISTDPGVFIRSMAARGSLGGLATSTREVADMLDVFGFERIITETVGVGQSELEIAGAADTTVVVLVPDSGDLIQAMKAGLMEVADVFVVNKADRPGADRLVQELELMLHMRLRESAPVDAGHHGVVAGDPRRRVADRVDGPADGAANWRIPVLRTVALEGDGVPDLLDALDRHATYLGQSGELSRRRRDRVVQRVRGVVDRELRRLAWDVGKGEEILTSALADLEAGADSPYAVAARIVAAVRLPGRGEQDPTGARERS